MKHLTKLGLVGAGQLAMLSAYVGKKYNITIECLDPNDKASASKYCKIIKSNYNNERELIKLFEHNDFVSYEFENIDLKKLKEVIKKYPNKCIQDIYPLFLTNNRIREKINLRNLNIATNKFSSIKSKDEIFYYLNLYQKPLVIKTAMFGYDGKNQVIVKDKDDNTNITKAAKMISEFECIVEEFIDFKFEISLTGIYLGNDKFIFLPINKNLHQKGILYTAQPLIDKNLQSKAEDIFKKLAKGIAKKSIYTIEFFVTKENGLYVNEIAPRVHNSSHHGIDNYNISQYDLFLNVFFDLKLPKVKVLHNKILINVLGQHYQKVKDAIQNEDNNKVKFYDYYKGEARTNRKMAHLIIDETEIKLVNKYKEWCKI